MVDLKNQYLKIKTEIDDAIMKCVENTQFINGPAVNTFEYSLKSYLNVKHVIPCANGTDSLQIAMMALGLKPGDEVICPAFTYVATAEVIGLLGLTPVMVDVDLNTFNITADIIERAITSKTKAIVPVHLYGQSCDMEPIINLARKHKIFIIEDNAQAIGSEYTFTDGTSAKTGTMGDIGSISFFPSKNLGCFGDGGALTTNNDKLASKMRMIANHGQEVKYFHKVLGCNSRLDTLQAAVLNVKLKRLDEYIESRNAMAKYYDLKLGSNKKIQIPVRQKNSNHVFHQYTLRVKDGARNELQKYLSQYKIPTMVYYPYPLYKQPAFQEYVAKDFVIPNVELLCSEVISIPIHTEINLEHISYICEKINKF